MGLFTRFKPLTSWTIQELLAEDLKLTKLGFECLYNRPEYDKVTVKRSEIENEFSRRGLNSVDEINKQLRTFKL